MAKMGPLPIGRFNKHVNESYGADNNIMKFYITEYSSKVSKDNFQPRYGKHVGTGYKSNLRPGVYYSRKLDELDNPIIGHMISDNYHSITQKHYQPTKGCNGKEPLRSDVSITSTGFVKDLHKTIPSYNQVHSVFSADASRLKSKPPLLGTIKNKDPLDLENNNHGPTYFSTEHASQFQQKQPHVETQNKSVGYKEESGFTHSKNLEPLTFRPDDCHDGFYPGWWTFRPTGVSMMKTAYLPHQTVNGKEPLKDVLANADRDNGFTRFIQPTAAHTAAKGKAYTKLGDITDPSKVKKMQKSDPAEYSNLIYPNRFPSLNGATYQGKQLHEPSLIDKLGNVTIGPKEDSGFVENNKSYTSKPYDFSRYNTVYKGEYYDKNHAPRTEYSKINDEGIGELQGDGFTKSEKLHSFGQPLDASENFRTLHPYVNRSLKARDPFYAERIHENKKRQLILH